MYEVLEKLLESIAAYGLINNFIPGAVYIVFVERFTNFRIETTDTLFRIVVCYFAGLIIDRIGSLFIEKRVIRNKVETAPHNEFTKAEMLDKDKKITILSAVNNMYRTFVSVAVCLLLTVLADLVWTQLPQSCRGCLKSIIVLMFCGALAWLFTKSYRKQTGYVVDRIKTVLEVEEKNKKDIEKMEK